VREEVRRHKNQEFRAPREAYRNRDHAFVNKMQRRAHGPAMQIFVGHVGSPIYRATLRALSRERVVATVG
jgi:hypothetical protein